MTNIVPFRAPQWTAQSRIAGLIKGFAAERRDRDDVFWLKENAELLNILLSSGAKVASDDLAPFEPFYAELEKRARFFPQYYRFFLSLALDLEELGLQGDLGARLCHWAHRAGLHEAELSDLQRAEAQRLYARRGVGAADAGLMARLHHFIDRFDTFALPNRKAGYELTHIVFYLSEYGTQDPGLSDAALTSLEYAGLLAYLDQNIDLLAEICVALRMAGRDPSAIWQDAVDEALSGARLVAGQGQDDYHAYLVAAWAARMSGGEGFDRAVPEGPFVIGMPNPSYTALRPMSEVIFAMDDQRNGDWSRMRAQIASGMGADAWDVLEAAERSTDKFDAFFEGFARAG